jgi:WD40 repeat protein
MKSKWFTSKLVTSIASLALTSVWPTAAVAKGHHDNDGFKVITVRTLDDAKTTDLFLLKGQNGKKFLYLASANGKLSIFDVTHPSNLREVSSWTLAPATTQTFHVRPISDRFAVASDSNTADELTALDLSKTAAEEIARRFKNVDAYAIDGNQQVLYVARQGELTVVRFDHPITREAERWEQSFEAR